MSVKQLLIPSYTGNGTGMGSIGTGTSESYGYKDPYSGKVYGSTPYAQLVQTANNLRANISQQLNTPSYSMSGSSLNSAYNPNGFGMASFVTGGGAQQTLGQHLTSKLASIVIPKKEDYVYQADMDKSYATYGGNWNKYWEGSYKNPRLAESNATMKNPLTQQVQTQDAKPQNNLRIPKAVGTGISSTGSLNPFGRLDAGLNI